MRLVLSIIAGVLAWLLGSAAVELAALLLLGLSAGPLSGLSGLALGIYAGVRTYRKNSPEVPSRLEF